MICDSCMNDTMRVKIPRTLLTYLNMKNNRLTFLALLMLMAFTSVYAQTGDNTYTVCNVKNFIKKITAKGEGVQSPVMNLQLPETKSIDVKIIADQSEGGSIKVYGQILGAKTSVFYLYGNVNEIKGKIL